MTMCGAHLGELREHGPMIENLVHTFRTGPSSMRWMGFSVLSAVKALRAAKEFEVCIDANTPLSIWYDGMLSACENPDRVIAQLR